MHPGLLDVLHHPGHEHRLAVAEGVDVHLGGAGEVLVDQHRAVARHLHGGADVAIQLFVVADDLHGPAAQHVGGPDHHRIADLMRPGEGLVPGAGDGVDRLGDVQPVQQLLEAFAVFGEVDGVRGGAEDWHAGVLEGLGQLQRSLTAELHDDPQQLAPGHLNGDQLQHVLGGQRLEIEPVGGVVVGGDGLGVAVDHDRLHPDGVEGEGGVAAAVVELDPLADPVRPAAEDDRLLPPRGLALAGGGLAEGAGLIGGIHVGRGGAELAGAGVDALEHRPNARRLARRAHLGLGLLGQLGQARVGKAQGLQPAHLLRRGGKAVRAQLGFFLNQGLDLAQEPGLVGTGDVHLVDGQAMAEGLGDDPQAVGRRLAQGAGDGGLAGLGVVGPVDLDFVEAGQARLQAAQGLLQALGEGAADGHDLAHRLHRGGEIGLGARVLLEGEAGDFGDDVVDGGLERGGGGASDVVHQLVEGVADGQARCDLGDGKAGCLGGEGG